MCAGGTRAHTENGLKPQTSRDPQENSNAHVVRAPFDRRFIAAIDQPADEIFSRDFGLKPGDAVIDRRCLRVKVPVAVSHCRLRRAEKPSQQRKHFIQPVMMKPVSSARDLLQFGMLEMREQAGGFRVRKKAFGAPYQ